MPEQKINQKPPKPEFWHFNMEELHNQLGDEQFKNMFKNCRVVTNVAGLNYIEAFFKN